MARTADLAAGAAAFPAEAWAVDALTIGTPARAKPSASIGRVAGRDVRRRRAVTFIWRRSFSGGMGSGRRENPRQVISGKNYGNVEYGDRAGVLGQAFAVIPKWFEFLRYAATGRVSPFEYKRSESLGKFWRESDPSLGCPFVAFHGADRSGSRRRGSPRTGSERFDRARHRLLPDKTRLPTTPKSRGEPRHSPEPNSPTASFRRPGPLIAVPPRCCAGRAPALPQLSWRTGSQTSFGAPAAVQG